METIKLYYQDAFLRRFDATVLDCAADKKAWRVVLDRTAFYPEGGGQGADHGTLGGVNVRDVHETDGVIYHTCDKPLPVGETVTGEIDWQRRFDHMQQHSGEHIVSGMLCSTYHCDNTGFHMGADTVTIDYNADIPWEGVLEIERRANRYIWENHPIVIRYPEPAELAVLPYRSKKALEGPVRITEFPRRGHVRLLRHPRGDQRSGGTGEVHRLAEVPGRRAAGGAVRTAGAGLSGAELAAEQRHRSRAVGEARRHPRRRDAAEGGAFRRKAAVRRAGNRAFRIAGRPNMTAPGNVLLVQPPMESDAARRLCDMTAARCGGRCAVFAGQDGAYKYAVIHPGADIRELIKTMNAALNGRGGGRDGFAQGSAACTEAEIRSFFGGLN